MKTIGGVGDDGIEDCGNDEEGGGRESDDLPRWRSPLLLHQSTSTNQQRERHIVTWTRKEDDLLREQVGIHGTENWPGIAVLFDGKTGRQCRRRWYSYLNTECKKGCWSPEEDMILCEAQKIFGNRWTEIAKVFPGRTDNAVKNRFSTLCKKRAKSEALSKENNCFYPTLNKDENVGHQNQCITAVQFESSSSASLKKIRYQETSLPGDGEMKTKAPGVHKSDMENRRMPLAVLVPNIDTSENRFKGSSIGIDGPKPLALAQQLEPIVSPARGHSVGSEHSLESNLKELNYHVMRSEDIEHASGGVSQIDLVLDVKHLPNENSNNMENHLSRRQSELFQCSPLGIQNGNVSISEFDAPADSKVLHVEKFVILRDKETPNPEASLQIKGNASQGPRLLNASLLSFSSFNTSLCKELKEKDGTILTSSNAKFSSPQQTMPIFSPFSDENPSPNFSTSERQFVLSALGLSSTVMDIPTQEPSCKKALINNLR